MRSTNRICQFFLIFLLGSFSLAVYGQNKEILKLNPEIRFRYPWTPVHEMTADDAIEMRGVLNLEGIWDFWPDLGEDQAMDIITGKNSDTAPKNLNVPNSSIGWGFDAEDTGLFMRHFKLSHSWHGRKVKIKCEGIFERAQIFVNGKPVQDHVGWTPFERDITDLVNFEEENRIAVLITMDQGYGPVDRYRMRQGGYPDIGGILRPIYIHAVPEVHIMDLFLIPRLNAEKGQWSLEVQVTLVNPTDTPAALALRGSLVDQLGVQTSLSWMDNIKVKIPPGTRITKVYSGPTEKVLPWNAEEPHLYHLAILIDNKNEKSVVAGRFGFRTVGIKDEKFLLNNRKITFRGIAYKGGHADYGNASPEPVLRQEVELIKKANVNMIRFGWSFKGPALHRICDAKGMYTICSVGPDQFYLDEQLSIQQYCEAFMCLKNSPAILMWELMNENPRIPTPAYLKIMNLGREIDPDRKFCHPGADYEELDIRCPHYLPKLFLKDKRDGRPFLPTEYVHTASYELDKLKYDPGIHDLWGYSLKRGWDIIRENPWVVGCIAFAWRDPYIRDRSGKIIPALHHESRWGVVDESFRIKPEYHHLFKVYSPIRISTQPILVDGKKHPEITIENLYDFINTNTLMADWKILDSEGIVADQGQWNPDIEPGAEQKLEVPAIPGQKRDYILQLSFTDKSDRLVQRVMIPYIWNNSIKQEKETPTKGKLKIIEEEELVIVAWEGGEYRFNKSLGILQEVKVGPEEMSMAGPDLNQRVALPRPGRSFHQKYGVENWTRRIFSEKLVSFDVVQADDGSEVRIEMVRQYQNGNMKTVYDIHSDGKIDITCTLPPKGYGVSLRFKVTARVTPDEMKARNRRKAFTDRLSWRKNGLWSWFPEDHPGRNVGVSSLLKPHDPQNRAMKINTAFLAVGSNDKSMNMVIRDPEAKIHVKCDHWYNESEIFIQGHLEDDYDYFDRVNPLRAMPHALSEDQRTYSFTLQFVDKQGFEEIEKQELNLHHTLVERSKFWDNNVDDLSIDEMSGTVKGLPPNYSE